jgi:hypothetical protein
MQMARAIREAFLRCRELLLELGKLCRWRVWKGNFREIWLDRKKTLRVLCQQFVLLLKVLFRLLYALWLTDVPFISNLQRSWYVSRGTHPPRAMETVKGLLAGVSEECSRPLIILFCS